MQIRSEVQGSEATGQPETAIVADFKQTEAVHVSPPAQILATPMDFTFSRFLFVSTKTL